MTSHGAVQALAVLLPSLYLVSSLLHGMAFGGDKAPKVAALRVWALRLTVLAHAGLFVAQAEALASFPIVDAFSTLSALAFCVALFHVVIARWVGHIGAGGIVLSVVFVLQLIASAFGNWSLEAAAEAANPVTIVHVSTVVLAASAVVLSGLHGALYLVLFRQMRRKNFGPLFDHLPDLSLLARMTRFSAMFGFVALTVGLNVGIGMAHAYSVEGFSYSDPSVILTIMLWLHFGVIAFSRFIAGLSAWRASWAAAAGLLALLLILTLTLVPGVTFHSLR